MGLRSPSGWQPQDTRSQMSQGNVPGMTPKQEDMSFARSPMAGNRPNEVAPKEEPGTTAGERAQSEQEARQEEAAKTSTQARQQQQASPVSMAVENVASKLSTLSYSLRGYVNQFLQGGAETVGLGKAEEKYVIDPVTGKYTLTIADQQADIEPVLQAKEQQQGRIKTALSPFAREIGGKLVGKQFEEVIGEQFGEDPQISSLLQMVSGLQEMESRGLGGSPEARALEAQLREQDQFGMVSSLREAMQTYNRLMGVGTTGEETKWYGDAADTGYSALDLAQLGTENLRTEIEKAREFSSGLFGGDFEENLKKKFDTESAEGQAASRRKEAIHTELLDAFSSFSDEAGDTFTSAKEGIDTAMKAASEAVWVEMQLSPEGREAAAWFQGVQGGNLSDILYDALSDPNSGLGQDQRNKIAEFIGKVGSGSKEGQLYVWMDSLGRTGKIPIQYTDSSGNPATKFVEPTLEDKLNITTLSKNTTMSPEEKTERMHELIRGIGIDKATNIGTSVDSALDVAQRTGSLAAGLVVFNRSLAESLKTFAKSKSEDFTRQILGIDDKEWAAMDAEQRSAEVVRVMANLTPEQKAQFQELIKGKQDTENTNLEALKGEVDSKFNGRQAELDNLAKFDEAGNLTGGALFDQQQTLTNQATAIPRQITNSMIQSVAIPSGRANEIYKSVIANKWLVNNVPNTQLGELASLMAMQERFDYLASFSPELVKILTGGAYQRIDPVDVAMSGVKVKDFSQLTNLFKKYEQAYVNMLDTKGQEALYPKIEAYISSLRTPGATVPPTLQTVVTTLDSYDNTMQAIQDNVTKAKEFKTTLESDRALYANLLESAELPSFTPDQLLGFSMGLARTTESAADVVTGDKPFPEINWGKIVEEGKGLVEGLLGYGPDAVKDYLTRVIGIPPESIAWDKGIPYIKMDQGEYVQLSDGLMTKLLADTSANLPTMVAGLPAEYGGPQYMASKDALGSMANVPVWEEPTQKRTPAADTWTVPETKDLMTMGIGIKKGMDKLGDWLAGGTAPSPSEEEIKKNTTGVTPLRTQPSGVTTSAKPTGTPPSFTTQPSGVSSGPQGSGGGVSMGPQSPAPAAPKPAAAKPAAAKPTTITSEKDLPPSVVAAIDAQVNKVPKAGRATLRKTLIKAAIAAANTPPTTQQPSVVTQPSGVSSGPQGSGGGVGFRR